MFTHGLIIIAMKADNELSISVLLYFKSVKKSKYFLRKKKQNKTTRPPPKKKQEENVSYGVSRTPDLWRVRSTRYLLCPAASVKQNCWIHYVDWTSRYEWVTNLHTDSPQYSWIIHKQKGHFSWRIFFFAVMVLAFATYALYILPVSSSDFLGSVFPLIPHSPLCSLYACK